MSGLPKKQISLMYHDVVSGDDWDASGFKGNGAERYKMTAADFGKHLAALASLKGAGSGSAARVLSGEGSADGGFFLTFDDGGASAGGIILEMLEEHGFIGHFFITASRIGEPEFVTEDQIRSIRDRGHVVGSHSWSHPLRFGTLSDEKQRAEWSRSIERLSSILGEKVTVASVPGGYYTRAVAENASKSGIRFLFNSEPVVKLQRIKDVIVAGRYAVLQHTTANECRSLATGALWPGWRQAVWWNAKKIGKRMFGSIYLKVRKSLLER
jgi:peptidoglycan/xylan/chitin deacetylase (PgdA/CDA1 family)